LRQRLGQVSDQKRAGRAARVPKGNQPIIRRRENRPAEL
jgi:hypothetical protein